MNAIPGSSANIKILKKFQPLLGYDLLNQLAIIWNGLLSFIMYSNSILSFINYLNSIIWIDWGYTLSIFLFPCGSYDKGFYCFQYGSPIETPLLVSYKISLSKTTENDLDFFFPFGWSILYAWSDYQLIHNHWAFVSNNQNKSYFPLIIIVKQKFI